METYVMSDLTEIEEIDLIYSNNISSDEEEAIKYTIVLNVDSLVEDLELYNKIYKIIERAKKIVNAMGKNFECHLTTKKNILNDIYYNNQAFNHELITANVLYSKDIIYIGNIIRLKEKANKRLKKTR